MLGTISNCYNTGDITGTKWLIAGICGANSGGTISNCYNTGTITCTYSVGGISGGNVRGTILNCYNIGNMVYNRNEQIGSISGHNGESSKYKGGTISNCYYLNKGNKGIGYSYGATKNETFSKTDEEIKAMSDEISDEFILDIQNKDKTWKYNNGYPILKWQKQEK